MDDRMAHLLDAVRATDDAATREATTHEGTTHEVAGVPAAWRELFARDPMVATAAAFDLLAGEPRLKPSRRLVVDPGDSVRQRWDLRVAAAAALLASPAAPVVFDELRDELAEDTDLAADVLTTAQPCAALTADQLGALRLLGLPGRHPLPR